MPTPQRRRGRWRHGCTLLLGVSSIAACAPPARPPQFAPRQQAPLACTPAGQGSWPQRDWWKRYRDPQLHRLMTLAMRDSPDLEQAQARYTAAQRAVEAQAAQLNPQVRGYLGRFCVCGVESTDQQPGRDAGG